MSLKKSGLLLRLLGGGVCTHTKKKWARSGTTVALKQRGGRVEINERKRAVVPLPEVAQPLRLVAHRRPRTRLEVVHVLAGARANKQVLAITHAK